MGFSFCKQLLHSQLTRGKDDAIPACFCVLVSVSRTKTVSLAHLLLAEEAKFVTNELVTTVY